MGYRVGRGIIGWLVLSGAAIAATGPENLLRNGSFEAESSRAVYTDALYWRYADPDSHGDAWGSASRENWRAVDGDYIGSVRGLWANQGDSGGVWQEVRAVPGQTYRFSGWFFCDPEWMARTQEIMLEFWNEDYRERIAVTKRPIAGCDIDWTEFSVDGRCPPGATWVRVVINVADIGAAGSLQFDNLQLVMTAAGPE